MNLPILYKKTSTGAIQQWTISTAGATIRTSHGQVDGVQQLTQDTVTQGKNIGKKNATTPEEQAEAEARAKWTKKREREGYVEDIERAKLGETDAAGGIPPMLAQPIKVAKHKIVYPADGQRKYNGNRCLAVIEDGVCTLWTRKQKRLLGVPHIEAAYERMFKGIPGRYVVDGELYRHGWSLQKISGFARKAGTKPGYLEIWHQIYDMPSSSVAWSERRASLEAAFSQRPVGPLRLTETFTIGSESYLKPVHDRFVSEGYEGLIIRNRAGKYEEGKRSYDLIKYKEFEELEFEIIGFGEGRGKFKGKAIFVCKTLVPRDGAEAKEFECCAPGTMEERAEMFEQGDKLIGKHLTVKFFEWTDEGKPSHGSGLVVRDYE